MARVEYNKLVRDNMDLFIERHGNKPWYRFIYGDELDAAIQAKVLEEAKEFANDGSAAELADLYAIMERAAIRFGGLDKIRVIADAKAEAKGGFNNGMFLMYVEGDNIPGATEVYNSGAE